MTLTLKGKKIKKAIVKFYKKKTGSTKKGEEVFAAMEQEGKLKGVIKRKK